MARRGLAERFRVTSWIELGAVAQLGERLVCNQEVAGSNPVGSSFSGAGLGVAAFVGKFSARGVLTRLVAISKLLCS